MIFLVQTPFLRVCRSSLASTKRSPPCSTDWITTGVNGKLSQTSVRPSWRPSKMRRKSWKAEANKVSIETTTSLLLSLCFHCPVSSNCRSLLFFLRLKKPGSRRHARSARPARLSGHLWMFVCMCICTVCVCAWACVHRWENFNVQKSLKYFYILCNV